MDKKIVEKVKELDFNIHLLKNIGIMLEGKKPKEGDEPFFGNIGTLEQLPEHVRKELADVCNTKMQMLQMQLDRI